MRDQKPHSQWLNGRKTTQPMAEWHCRICNRSWRNLKQRQLRRRSSQIGEIPHRSASTHFHFGPFCSQTFINESASRGFQRNTQETNACSVCSGRLRDQMLADDTRFWHGQRKTRANQEIGDYDHLEDILWNLLQDRDDIGHVFLDGFIGQEESDRNRRFNLRATQKETAHNSGRTVLNISLTGIPVLQLSCKEFPFPS